MKKQLFATVSISMALLVGLATGCGSDSPTSSSTSSDDQRPSGTKIVIYAGGSSEFSWVKGSEENRIIDYIEEKYYEETGNSLDFDISYLGEDMQTKLQSELAAGTQVDVVISHTRGGVGIDDKLKGSDMHRNLYDAIFDYAPNLYEQIKGAPLNCLTTSDNDVVAIPSVISPYKFGILVRKDYMEACGYTDDVEKAKTEFQAGKNYELVDNLETFKEMCLAMNSLTNNAYAVTGAIWDLEKVLTLGAFGDAGYFSSMYVEKAGSKSRIMSGWLTDEYQDVLNLEYDWVTSGVISKDANSTLLEQGESNFISGKTGVFVQDPTIQHLIKVARMTKANDPDAEFTVLGALKAKKTDGADAKKGFMRNPEATFGAAIPYVSNNVRPIMQFLNWVYASADNYNLCRYGIEGEHWVNNGDGTYSYPAGKEKYETQPAYSGILTFVENQRISNLTYSGYSSEELRWINEIAGNKENYLDNDVMDYLFTSTDAYNQLAANSNAQIYQLCTEIWTGKKNPKDTNYATLVTNAKAVLGDMQDFYTLQYLTMKQQREAK